MIIKESPDNVTVAGVNKHWSSRDAVCFSLIDGICVYEEYSSKPGSHDFLIAALFHILQNGEEAIKDLSSSGVMVKGSMNDKAKTMLKPLLDSVLSGKGGFRRDKCMSLVPSLIHGRLWRQEPKIVSFWNDFSIVERLKNEVLDFVKIYGDPKSFVYDTEKGQLSFEEFMGSKTNTNNAFNKYTLHTMAPSPEKKMLQNQMGAADSKFGSRSPNYPDARSRASMSTSEGFSFLSWIKRNQ